MPMEYSRLEWRIRHGAPGYKSGDPRPDFFTGEKPVVQITKANMAKYADKLTDGRSDSL